MPIFKQTRFSFVASLTLPKIRRSRISYARLFIKVRSNGEVTILSQYIAIIRGGDGGVLNSDLFDGTLIGGEEGGTTVLGGAGGRR